MKFCDSETRPIGVATETGRRLAITLARNEDLSGSTYYAVRLGYARPQFKGATYNRGGAYRLHGLLKTSEGGRRRRRANASARAHRLICSWSSVLSAGHMPAGAP